MAFCPKCGVQVEDGTKFCPACGAPLAAAEPADKKEEFKEKIEGAANDVKEKATEFAADVKEKIADAKAAAAADDNEVYEKEDIDKNKAMAILAYFGILVLIPIFAAKESKFARFHANQGLILFICCIVLSILTAVPVVKWFVGILNIVVFVFAIMGIVAAAKGEAKELPIVGKYRFLK